MPGYIAIDLVRMRQRETVGACLASQQYVFKDGRNLFQFTLYDCTEIIILAYKRKCVSDDSYEYKFRIFDSEYSFFGGTSGGLCMMSSDDDYLVVFETNDQVRDVCKLGASDGVVTIDGTKVDTTSLKRLCLKAQMMSGD